MGIDIMLVKTMTNVQERTSLPHCICQGEQTMLLASLISEHSSKVITRR